jgi:NAD(P)-dependent dehydrogenase (short-subunit alcohol dehydrogenase family)
VSSAAGISGVGSSIAYAASKGALNTLTLSLSRALAPTIRVNTVCPGYIDTPWFTKGRGEAGAKLVRDSVIAKVPLKVASTAEDFQRIFAVNTIGPYQMIRAARSLLEAAAKASHRASAVVNVSSVAGISGVGSSVAYAASKGALNTMTYSLARALAPLIRVNTVCPGYIDTPWFTKGRGEAGAKQVRDTVVSRVPLKVASSADNIAQLVCFLAGPSSSHMTGELVRMDAGMHLIA